MSETIKPTVVYGELEQPMHKTAQYLLMQANLINRVYLPYEFIEAINKVALDKVPEGECRNDVENQRIFLRALAKTADTVTIKNFQPDRAALEEFVNTTFKEMHDRL